MSSLRHQVNLALGGHLGNGVSDEELRKRVVRAAKAEAHLPELEAAIRRREKEVERKNARIEKLEQTIAEGEVPPGRYCYVSDKRRRKVQNRLDRIIAAAEEKYLAAENMDDKKAREAFTALCVVILEERDR